MSVVFRKLFTNVKDTTKLISITIRNFKNLLKFTWINFSRFLKSHLATSVPRNAAKKKSDIHKQNFPSSYLKNYLYNP